MVPAIGLPAVSLWSLKNASAFSYAPICALKSSSSSSSNIDYFTLVFSSFTSSIFGFAYGLPRVSSAASDCLKLSWS